MQFKNLLTTPVCSQLYLFDNPFRVECAIFKRQRVCVHMHVVKKETG